MKDSPLVVYEGVSGVRANIRGQSGHTAVCIETKRKMMVVYRGLDVDCFAQDVNRWLSLTAPVAWGTTGHIISMEWALLGWDYNQVQTQVMSETETASLVMSLRRKSRLRSVDWMDVGGLQVGLRAPLLTAYLLQGGRVSARQHNHSMQETEWSTWWGSGERVVCVDAPSVFTLDWNSNTSCLHHVSRWCRRREQQQVVVQHSSASELHTRCNIRIKPLDGSIEQ